MAGMIRLRPTQIILTREEVSKTPRKSHLVIPGSPPFSRPLPWDHNITIRRNRNTKLDKVDKAAQYFGIHEDGTTIGQIDSGEISDMSDFSFGPIPLNRNLLDMNTLFAETNSSSEAGDEGSGDDVDDECSNRSISCEGIGSVKTLMNDNSNGGTLHPSTCIDGSISLTNERHNSIWEVYSDSLIDHGLNEVQGDSFIDIEYLADIELSAAGDDGFSGQDSDIESHVHESYSLPMDGTTECRIREGFANMHLYASPISLHQGDDLFHSRETRSIWEPGAPGALGGAPIPLTQPSAWGLLEDVSSRLGDITGISPRHIAVSHVPLARYRSRSLQNPILTRQASDQEEVSHYRRSSTSDMSLRSSLDNSPPPSHSNSCAVTFEITSSIDKPYETYIGDSDSYIKVTENSSKITGDEGYEDEDEYSEADREREDTEKKLFG